MSRYVFHSRVRSDRQVMVLKSECGPYTAESSAADVMANQISADVGHLTFQVAPSTKDRFTQSKPSSRMYSRNPVRTNLTT